MKSWEKNVKIILIKILFLDSAEDYNPLNDSIDSTGGHDKDIVIAEHQKISELDNKTKLIYNATSKKTIELLSSLHSIKYKNSLVSAKNPDLDKLIINLPEKIDIFENLIDDEEAKKLEREEKEANNKILLLAHRKNHKFLINITNFRRGI